MKSDDPDNPGLEIAKSNLDINGELEGLFARIFELLNVRFEL